jgi:urea transport system permease protein
MILRCSFVRRCVALVGFLLFTSITLAATPTPSGPSADIQAALLSLKITDAAGRQTAYDLFASRGDARLIPALTAYRNGALLLRNGQLVIYGPRVEISGIGSVLPLIDALTGDPIKGDDGKPIYSAKIDLSSAIKSPPYREKRVLADIISGLALNDPDPDKHRAAIRDAGDRTEDSLLKPLQTQLAANPGSPFAADLKEAIARLQLRTGSRDQKVAAVPVLAAAGTNRALSSLNHAYKDPSNANDKELLTAIEAAQHRVEHYQTVVSALQNTFAGLSLGSILVLLALGLSIIFGLMGVINMAHGEFMMVGAFTTYVVSQFWKAHFGSDWYGYYPIAAIPAAFIVSALMGYIVEMVVIRHLYGRPLETLLATWGVSLILIQLVRQNFGDTESVTPPHWMEGGVEAMPDLYFPLNRIYIILYCAICISVVYFIVNKTKLGLLLRATTQNREMASALGVATRRVDALTFAFGTGLAGLAGVVVPLYNKINPSVGQEYIVDSFLVVVTGGVGKLAGAIIAGLGLGFINKYLEPIFQLIPALASGASVLGKVFVLGLVVVFLQYRPAGLFPPKGRGAND